MLAQERQRIALDNAGLFDKTMDAAERRVKAGDLSRADLARLNVDALRARNEVENARLEREKAQVALAFLIGMERDARKLRAADDWPPLRALPAGAELDRLVNGRADVLAAQARVQQASTNRELAQSLRTADITAGVEYDVQPTDVVRNSVGFNVSVPLFTRYYYQGEIKRAEADFLATETSLERVRAAAISEISAAAATVASASERVRTVPGTTSCSRPAGCGWSGVRLHARGHRRHGPSRCAAPASRDAGRLRDGPRRLRARIQRLHRGHRARENTMIRIVAALLILGLVAACGKEAAAPSAPEPRVEGDTVTFPDPAKAPPLATKVVTVEPAPTDQVERPAGLGRRPHGAGLFSPFAGRVARILVNPATT